jgi:amino acid transporter
MIRLGFERPSESGGAQSGEAFFSAHRLMRRVDPRTHTPVPATILIVVIGVILMAALPGAALLELITASTILPRSSTARRSSTTWRCAND